MQTGLQFNKGRSSIVEEPVVRCVLWPLSKALVEDMVIEFVLKGICFGNTVYRCYFGLLSTCYESTLVWDLHFILLSTCYESTLVWDLHLILRSTCYESTLVCNLHFTLLSTCYESTLFVKKV